MKRLTEKEYEGYDDLNDDHYFVEYGVDLIDLPIIEDEAEVDFVGHDPEIRRRHTSELQSRRNLVCRLLLEKKKKKIHKTDGSL